MNPRPHTWPATLLAAALLLAPLGCAQEGQLDVEDDNPVDASNNAPPDAQDDIRIDPPQDTTNTPDVPTTPDANTDDTGDDNNRDVGDDPIEDINEEPPDDRPPPDCGAMTVCGVTCVDLQTDPTSCGFCGRTCILPNAESGCVAGQCAVATCQTGYLDVDGNPDNGCEAENNCNEGAFCDTACGSEGTIVCNNNVETCAPPPESCNAVDDNCDGACDEGPIPGCRVGVHRGSGNGHIYSTNLGLVSNSPFRLERQNYFYVYSQSASGFRPLFLCPKGGGKRFLSSDTACEIGRAPEAQLGFWSPTPVCGAIPLYRLYSQAANNHFYTTSAPERDNAVNNLGYILEGIPGYVFPAP